MTSHDEQNLLSIFQTPSFYFAAALQNNVSVTEAASRYAGWAEESRKESRRKNWFMSIRTIDNIYIGAVILLNLNDHETYGREVEIAYFIHNNFHNRGYAFEAADQVIKFAKHSLQVKSIYATAHPDNLYSRRVLEKLGLKLVGRDEISKFKTREGKPDPRLNYRITI